MNKQYFIRGLCLLLTLFNLSDIYAQKFDLAEMLSGWGRGKEKSFTSTKKYGYQWTLTTDAKNGDALGTKPFLHIGTSPSPASTISLTSKSPIGNIDIIRISTWSSDAYTLSLSVDDEEIRSIQMNGGEYNLISSFNVHGKNGTVKFAIVPQHKNKAAVFVGFIELSATLSDQQVLQAQHIKSGKTYSYQVQRMFASDHWNTICLPFDVSKEALTEAMGESCALREFNKKVDNNVLKFDNADAIEAGVPYLIKPAAKVKNPIFSNVVYKDVEPQTVQDETGRYAFVGTFDPVNVNVDGSDLFLLANGNLAKPKSEEVSQMYGMRAYFKINEQSSSSAKQITYAIDCGSETVNGIQSLHSHPSTRNQHIYNLQGVDVGTDIHPLPAGVYVMDGKKIIKR
ncbi:hypothetical protein [Hoylesella buccalis]|uniref:Uncharacterized protein n=1 Tax=Hoylesella buccalis DNF00853 TaxID=1401074 RepID=A0A096B1E5_9BACT|nr:hypothetical protein [Hoylesella buccalis]KGF36652.1 hypothetical protein HMPREF2137_01245 [Hoylesella buccalis DNF00853]